MNLKIVLLIIMIGFSVSCSKTEKDSADSTEVIIDDGYKTTEKGDIVIEDKDLIGMADDVIKTSQTSSQGNNFQAADGSKISVMLDGFGNKSEMRVFNNHSRLQMIVVRTKANGQKQVLVYGRNGEVSELTPEESGKSLTASADELASAAGISSGGSGNNFEHLLPSARPKETAPIMPLPSYQIPVQSTPLPATTVVETTNTNVTVEEAKPADKEVKQDEAIKPPENSANNQKNEEKK